jgi:hypothetical protein
MPLQVAENKTSFIIQTLQQPVKTGKEAGEIIQQIKTFFHTQQGVIM